MTLRITCPGCKTSLKLGDDMRGRKVRCTHCDKGLNIPAANGKLRDEEEEEERDEEEERPAKKKKKKKKKGAPVGLLVGIGVGVLLLLIVGGVGATAYFLRENTAKPALPGPVAQNKDGDAKGGQAKDGQPDGWVPPQRVVVPGIKEGNPALKAGGKSITGNIRGAAYVTERKNDLAQIGKLFVLFYDSTPKSARTQDEFVKSIQRDAKSLADSIKDGYYVMNMRAELTGSSIIAYESQVYSQGYLCVNGNGVTDFVSEQDWKTALGK